MVSKRDRDTQEGMRVLAILLVIWTGGFIWITYAGTLEELGLGGAMAVCCNTINIILALVFISTWLYTRRENKVKDYLDENVKPGGTISVNQLEKEFGAKRSTIIKHLMAWVQNVEGDYDQDTGIFRRKAEPEEENNYCPNCGSKLSGESAHCQKCEEAKGTEEPDR